MRRVTVGLGLLLGLAGGAVRAEDSATAECKLHGHNWQGVCDNLTKLKVLKTFPVVGTAERWGWVWRAVHPDQLPPLLDFEKYFVLTATGPALKPPTIATALDDSGKLTVTRSQRYQTGKKFSYLLQVHRRRGVRHIGDHDLVPSEPSILTLLDDDRDFRAMVGERFVVELPGGKSDSQWRPIATQAPQRTRLVQHEFGQSAQSVLAGLPVCRFTLEAIKAGRTTLSFERTVDTTKSVERFTAHLHVLNQADGLKTKPVKVRLKTPGDGWDVRVVSIYRNEAGAVRAYWELTERKDGSKGGWTWAQETVHIEPPARSIHHVVLGKRWGGLNTPGITFAGKNALQRQAESEDWKAVDFIRFDSANRYAPRVRLIGHLPDRDIRNIVSAVRRCEALAGRRIDCVRVLDPQRVKVKMTPDAADRLYTAAKLVDGRWQVLNEEEQRDLEEKIRDARKPPNR